MKSLYESLLDDFDTLNSNIDPLEEIKQFLEENYEGEYIISKKPNKDGLYEVSSYGDIRIKNLNITSLTNDLFVWTKANKSFYGNYSKFLTSLEGAPKEVGGNFSFYDCDSLTSLKGAPEKVGGDFYCIACDSLKSLEGAPKKVGGNFNCSDCQSLPSLKGAPEEVDGFFFCRFCTAIKSLEGAPKKVGDKFSCVHCKSLKSLKGMPKEIGGDLECYGVDIKFTRKDIEKISKVGGLIIGEEGALW